MKKLLFILIVFSLISPVVFGAPNDVIINEYRINDDGSTNYSTIANKPIYGDWLELRVINGPIDLRSWRVTDNNTKTQTSAGSLIFANTRYKSAV